MQKLQAEVEHQGESGRSRGWSGSGTSITSGYLNNYILDSCPWWGLRSADKMFIAKVCNSRPIKPHVRIPKSVYTYNVQTLLSNPFHISAHIWSNPENHFFCFLPYESRASLPPVHSSSILSCHNESWLYLFKPSLCRTMVVFGFCDCFYKTVAPGELVRHLPRETGMKQCVLQMPWILFSCHIRWNGGKGIGVKKLGCH